MQKYLIVATPRSATAFTARLLSNLGLNCGHEKHFGLDTHLSQFLNCEGIVGDSSWLAVPFLNQLPKDVKILHQTRHPLKVIRSLLELQFLDFDVVGRPVRDGLRRRFTEFAMEHCPGVLEYNSNFERAAWFYYHWNRKIDAQRTDRELFRYNVDHFDTELLRQLLSFIGVDSSKFTNEQLSNQLVDVPKNLNAKKNNKVILVEEVTWQTIPAEVRDLAQLYGYSSDIVLPGDVTAVTNSCDEIFEQLREQVYRAQLFWREERERHREQIACLKSPAADRKTDRPPDSGDEVFESVRERIYRAQLAWRSEHEQLRGDLARMMQETVNLRTMIRELQICTRSAQQEATEVRREAKNSRQKLDMQWRERAEKLNRAIENAKERARVVALECGHLKTIQQQLNNELRTARHESTLAKQTTHAEQKRHETTQHILKKTAAELHLKREANKSIERLEKRAASLETELALRQQEVRYRLGDALVKAVRPSKDTLKLPVRLSKLFFEGLARRKERKQQSQTTGTKSAEQSVAGNAKSRPGVSQPDPVTPKPITQSSTPNVNHENRPAVNPSVSIKENRIVVDQISTPVVTSGPAGGFLFFCVNGAGLGHLTRSLAIARRIRRIEPNKPVYFLSSSQALDVISREGMIAYHIPPRNQFGEGMRAHEWNTLLSQQIELIVNTHHPSVLIYDGVFPYRGLLDAIHAHSFAHTAMVLRLRHKHGRLREKAELLGSFDQLVFPGEAGITAENQDLLPTEFTDLNCRLVEPIIHLDHDDLLARDEVRRQWDVSPDKKLIYVQLGAGNINNIAPWIERILAVLARRDDVEVVLAESPITDCIRPQREGVHVLRQYPNSRYFNGFDLAITATGYNTFHELMYFGVPSVLIPNRETKTDDQVARALGAHRALAAMAVLRPEFLSEAINLALTEEVAATMRAKATVLVPHNGATSVADYLVKVACAEPARV